MARAALEPQWRCLFANDNNVKKGDAYCQNWGNAEFQLGDVHELKAKDLPGEADLAWASFPCQDLSLAGNGEGLDGKRSGAFWGFHDVIYGLKTRKRAPKLLVLENVVGTLTSNGGRDFQMICRALKGLGYVYGAMVIDAVHFVPQSRPRLFIVAVRGGRDRQVQKLADGPSRLWTSEALKRAYGQLRPDLRQGWRWWSLPSPPIRNVGLSDLIIDDPPDVQWHSSFETKRLLSLMSQVNLAKIEEAQRGEKKTVGTIYKRTRLDELGRKVQRAEVRFDDISGCLRTPGGGSSRQTVIVVESRRIRTRLLSAKEAASLMGLDKNYRLPPRYNDAYHTLGDGLVVPVVRHLAENLLEPMLGASKSQMTRLVAAE